MSGTYRTIDGKFFYSPMRYNSCLYLLSENRWGFVWRVIIIQRNSFSYNGILVRTVIEFDRHTNLHSFFSDTATGQKYFYEILDPYVHHYADARDSEFVLVGNNAKQNRTRTISDHLVLIQRMKYTAYNPRTKIICRILFFVTGYCNI